MDGETDRLSLDLQPDGIYTADDCGWAEPIRGEQRTAGACGNRKGGAEGSNRRRGKLRKIGYARLAAVHGVGGEACGKHSRRYCRGLGGSDGGRAAIDGETRRKCRTRPASHC